MPGNPTNRTFEFPEPSPFDETSELIEAKRLFAKYFILQKRAELISNLDNDEVKETYDHCRQIYERAFKANHTRISHGGLNESDTESELIDPILTALGFSFLHRTRQDPGLVPDYTLYPDEHTKAEAMNLSDEERYRYAIGILEAKSFNKNLGSISKKETPGLSYSKQVRLYLDQGRNYFKWGILTNGREWRLYTLQAHRDDYFSIRLPRALVNLDDFKLFLALFGAQAFQPDASGRLLLDRLREQSESRQSQLEENLRQRVYVLAEWITDGFYHNSCNRTETITPEEAYKAALILLYRLMFILYAEARNLLPVNVHRKGARSYQRDYSLQRFIPWLKENNYVPEDDALDKYWDELVRLFEVIDGTREKACLRLGIPRFNGGLFDPRRYPELTRWRLGDWTVQETLKRLMFDIHPSHIRETIPISSNETIDYSTLSVQQLGSIYEGLLEYKPVLKSDGHIEVKADSEERWRTGSYYTPGWVVDYIMEETLRPLLVEIENSEAVLKAKHQKTRDNSFAQAVLKLRILDPAMGSGHFLVGATEYLADEIASHPTTITAVKIKPAGMTEDDAERAYWRRRVTENCLYGVDKNELAVELAKLSLWLTCISSTDSLSFLDHHFKAGDSLTGVSLREPLSKYKIEGLSEVRRAAAEAVANIFADWKDDYQTVKIKETRYKSEAADLTAPYEGLLDHFTKRDLAEKKDEAAFASEMEELLAQPRLPSRQLDKEFGAPLHFELAFPEVFPTNGESGGFDAVIGNPPYVRQEELGELKWYLQRNYEAYQGTADLYVYFIERGLKLLKPGGRFGFIVSNKWMRANYGAGLRKLLEGCQIEKMIDFSGLKVFETSTNDTMILTMRKQAPTADPLYASIPRRPDNVKELREMEEAAAFPMGKSGRTVNGFALVKKDITDIFEKMKAAGKPLGEYAENKIFYGIKTGLNKAFIIDSRQREELIRYDTKSEEIIVPILKGQDVRKWRVNYRNRYLILTKIGVEIEEYPGVFEYLQEFLPNIEARLDQGNHWWELRTCNFYDEFSKGKIIWPIITRGSRFAFDRNDYYLNDKCFMIPSEDLYLLGVLNSKLLWKFLLHKCSPLGNPERGGAIELRRVFLKKVPICEKSESNSNIQNEIAILVEKILILKESEAVSAGLAERRRLEKQITEAETEIDRLVYQLYGLTEREIRIIEGMEKEGGGG